MSDWPETTADHDAGPSLAGTRASETRVKKRILTDARREQNRQAQRAFRQRRKQLKRGSGPVVTNDRNQSGWSTSRRSSENVSIRSVSAAAKGSSSNGAGNHLPKDSTASGSIDLASDGSDAITTPDMGDFCCDLLNEGMLTMNCVTSSLLSATETGNKPNAGSTWNPLSCTAQQFITPESATDTHDPWMYASPYANSLNLLPTIIFSALIHNALSINIPLDLLTKCSRRVQSPFYNPLVAPDTDHAALLSAVRSALPPTVPDDLQPRLSQILIPHHPSLDLIPLPEFRDKAIMLCAAMPHLFDIWELKLDIYMRHGLTVWAAEHEGYGVGCQPWERRAWEASPWFLSKWNMALESDKGELQNQSRVFHALRRKLALDD